MKPSCIPLLLCAALTGCRPDLQAFAERFTTPAEREFATQYLELLAAGNVDSAFDLVVPELRTQPARDQLAAVAALLAAHPPESLALIGVHVHSSGDTRSVNLSWEYRSDEQWAVSNVATRYERAASPQVEGVHAQLLDQSLREANSFNLSGRSFPHYVWLVGVIALPIFCIGAAVRVAVAKGMPKRWLWAVFALVGVSQVSLNWTTGEVGMHAFSVALFGAGATKAGPAAPWILTLALPLGAALALIRYRQWRSREGKEGAGAAAI